MAIQARLISKSADGKRAQVVTYLGEGRDRRSVTSHIRVGMGVWMGPNPDKAAVGRTEAAEAALEEATARHEKLQPLLEVPLEVIERALADIRDGNGDVGRLPDELRPWGRSFLAALARNTSAEDLKARIERAVADAATARETAQKHLDEVKVPKEVEFTGIS